MNNFISTEKSLKRWLKNRVTVTTATVVGFLIAGTVVFGQGWQEAPTEDIYNIKTEYIPSGSQWEQYKWTVEKPDGSSEEAFGDYYGEVQAEKTGIVKLNGETATIEKGTKIIASSDKIEDSLHTPVVISTVRNGITKAINNGDIWLEGTGLIEGMQVSWGKESVLENNGNIYVNNSNAVAIGMNPGATAINTGNIYIKNGTGVASYGGKSFTNSGTIIANNGGKAINSSSKDFTLNLEKGSHIKGVIELSGENNTVSIDGVGTAETPEVNNIESSDVNIKINNSNVILEGALKATTTNAAVELLAGNGTITNKANISGKTGITTEDYIKYNTSAAEKFINEGTINATEFGIYTNAQIGTYIENVINNGEIILENASENAYGIYSAGLAQDQANARVNVENNGIIKVTGKDKVYGLRIHENAYGVNNNEISVSGETNAVGVSVTGGANSNILEELKENYINFENTGKISVKSINSIGMLLNHQAALYLNDYNVGTQDVVISAINKQNGVISAEGENAVGIKLTSAKREGLAPKDVKVKFVNEGTITLGEGTTNGIGILVEAGEAVNKGTISLGMKETGNQAIVNLDGTAKNSGIIKVSDMTKEEITAEVNKEEALEFLFDGTVEHTGLIVDKDGNALFLNGDTTVKEDTTTDILDGLAQGNGSVGVDGNITISGTGDHKVDSKSFNVSNGTSTIAGDVILDSDVINMDAKGRFAVKDGASLTLENGTVNKEGTEDKTAVELANGTLNVDNMEVNGDITGTGTINVTGDNVFNGNLTGTDSVNKLSLNFEKSTTELSAENKWSNVTGNIEQDGQLVLDVKADGTNAFGNSTGLELTGSNDRDVMFKTGNLTGKEIKLSLGDNSFINVDAITDSEIYITDGIVDNANGTKDEIVIKYNTKLFNDSLLDNMNNHASEVSNYFSADKAERKSQLDKLYSSNIYSETVRAAYDNAKLVEDTILSLDREAVVGKWTAEGKALYSKNEYDRTGLTKDYTSEIESTGLMAALKYGVNETTTAGIAFAGVKQDVDTDAGSADGDVFYLGAFADKELGNYTLTAGAGYQLGKYDADNTAAKTSDSSYDSNAFSAYVQGKYVADLEDGLTFEPKVKLGYTYIEQDDVTDSYFGVKDAELSTVDAEVGFDLVKTTQLEKAKLDVTFGASYIKAMGDTDKKFEGSFKGTAGTFDVLGAELAENTIKADLTAELTQENGFFYNAGVTYRFGSDNTKDYGANLGIGYQF